MVTSLSNVAMLFENELWDVWKLNALPIYLVILFCFDCDGQRWRDLVVSFCNPVWSYHTSFYLYWMKKSSSVSLFPDRCCSVQFICLLASGGDGMIFIFSFIIKTFLLLILYLFPLLRPDILNHACKISKIWLKSSYYFCVSTIAEMLMTM